ncbi:MAG: SGNH/GDSL hydrolase family protein [Eubacteriales bacterium]|nr:SGNH/GDSL hydrolase family protein [Eubacteriales bacterium]
MKKKVCVGFAVVLIPIVCLYFLQCLLVPKYATDIKEGAMIQEYYSSDKKHDVLILGDCEVYENISPVTMWENYGISCYIRGSAEQLIWQSYYLLEDTLRYEKPEVVVLNVLAMSQGEAKSEAYNRMTLDGMKWSKSKIESIKASMTDKEDMLSYIFPLLRYHSRWSELTMDDVKYMYKTPSVTTNGYLMQKGVRPVTTIPKVMPLPDYSFSEKNFEYLDKICSLCNNNGIKLVLMKAPSVYPHWYDEWDSQIKDYADKNNILYLNTINEAENIGIDYSQDTFDYGQHLNVNGAEKLSKYLGKQLVDNYGLKDHRNEEEYTRVWNPLVDKYYQEKQDE